MNCKRVIIFPIIAIMTILIEISCSNPETYYFKWDKISVENLELYYEGEMVNYRESDKLIFSPLTYGVRINLDYQLIASIFNLKIDLIQTANAFTKPSDEYILEDKIVSITIKSIYDFNNTHLAGSDISSCFKTLWYGEFVAIDSRLNGTNGLNEPHITESQLNEKFDIYLRENPTLGHTHQFEVKVIFESGNTLSELTKEIRIE